MVDLRRGKKTTENDRDESCMNLSQVWIFVVLFLNSQQYRGVPLIKSRDTIVVFDGIGESFDILFF